VLLVAWVLPEYERTVSAALDPFFRAFASRRRYAESSNDEHIENKRISYRRYARIAIVHRYCRTVGRLNTRISREDHAIIVADDVCGSLLVRVSCAIGVSHFLCGELLERPYAKA